MFKLFFVVWTACAVSGLTKIDHHQWTGDFFIVGGNGDTSKTLELGKVACEEKTVVFTDLEMAKNFARQREFQVDITSGPVRIFQTVEVK